MGVEGAFWRPNHARPDTEPVSYVDATGLLSIEVQQLDHAVSVVRVAGELDMLTGPVLDDHLSRLLATRPERLIIDLSQVSFLGSNGLSVLVIAQHSATQQDTAFQLRGTERRAVAVPLRITGLDHLFDIVPNSEP